MNGSIFPSDEEMSLKNSVLKNYRVLANHVLCVAGYGFAKQPWDIIDQVFQDYQDELNKPGLSADTGQIDRLTTVLYSLSDWYQAIIDLGNTVMPERVDQHPWHSVD